LRSSDLRGGSARASTSATFLPCSLAPLQSVTAVASRRGPFPGPGRCVCAGQEHIDLGRRTVHPVSVSHPRARRSDGPNRFGRANPTERRETPNRSQPVSVAVGSRAEAWRPMSSHPRARRRAAVFAANCPTTWPKPRRCACSSRLGVTEATLRASRAPQGRAERPEPPKRTGQTGRRSEACLTRHPAEAGDRCKTHSGAKRRRLPWGSFPFGDSSSGDRCVGLPDQHHPPSGFLTLSTV
jgi:hypothetical protein